MRETEEKEKNLENLVKNRFWEIREKETEIN